MSLKLDFLVAILFLNYVLAEDDTILRCVFESFRHGARGPLIGLGQKDFFGNEWPGAEELTNVGKRQHYLLGRKLRMRYRSFLASEFSDEEVYAFSTNYNRTVESALSHLQGLYYQNENIGKKLTSQQMLSAYPPLVDFQESTKEKVKNLKDAALPDYSSAVPVYVMDFSQRYFPLGGNCPTTKAFIDEKNKDEWSAMANTFLKKYASLLKDNFNIVDNKDLQTFHNVSLWVDTFLSNYWNNNDMSKLGSISAQDILNDALIFQRDQYIKYTFANKENYIMAKVASSAFFKDLLEYFDNRIKLDNEKKEEIYSEKIPKMKMFSGHDSSIAGQTVFLNMALGRDFSEYFIQYATNYLYELRKKIDKTYIVEIYYNFKQIVSMPYDEFKEKISKNIVSELIVSNFCNYTDENGKYEDISNLKIATIVLAIVAVVMILIIGAIILFGSKLRVKSIFENDNTNTTE